MFENKFVNTILALVLIFALIAGLIYYPFVKKFIPILGSIGEEEPGDLVKLKTDCSAKQTEGCALDVANGTISAGESPLIAASWVKKEIDFTNNEAILVEAYEFTSKTISPALKAPCEPFDIYLPLFEKLRKLNVAKTNEIKSQFTACGLDIEAIADGRAIPPPVTYRAS